MSQDLVIETQDMTREFKGFTAVNKVNLKVRRNTIHALIGPNGAGKTTCFNMITRMMPVSSGKIYFNGKDVTKVHPATLARMGMVRSFQISAVFGSLTVRDNLLVALQRRSPLPAQFWKSGKVLAQFSERAEELASTVGLESMLDAVAGNLSYGRKRALEIATTLALEPEVLLLDEPLAGMGQEDVERTAALIRKVAANRSILMVEHNISVVAALSDVITVLRAGEILAEGSYDEVSKQPEVIEAYMGSDALESEHV